MTNYRTWMARVALGLASAATITVAACDFSVTNPGPVADGNLDSLGTIAARRALATGARRLLGNILGAVPDGAGYGLAYWSAAAAFEINPAGSTGSWGIPPALQSGQLRNDDSPWSGAQEARWVTEDDIRRFKDRAAPEDSLYAALELWAGYANRLLGENFCDAVIDGGAQEPVTSFFSRAEGHFTEALRIANALTISAANKANLVNAATAGRASVRADLATWNGNNAATWATAIADANAVTSNTFVWSMPFYAQDVNQTNAVYWSIGNSPYRAHTNWGTYYEDYYRTTRDPRAQWDATALRGDAAVQTFDGYPNVVNSRVPFYPEGKYRTRDAAIRLSSGWEMRLLEAEYELAVNNDAAAAVAKMNLRRTNLSLPALTASTVAQAWTDLKRERMMELWLEARRLGDLRRWDASSAPGQAMDGVWVTGEAAPRETMTSPTARGLCWPVGLSELQTNPNLR
jgi:hypothetical protein